MKAEQFVKNSNVCLAVILITHAWILQKTYFLMINESNSERKKWLKFSYTVHCERLIPLVLLLCQIFDFKNVYNTKKFFWLLIKITMKSDYRKIN